MGRRRIDDTSHPDQSLTNEFWLRFSDNPQPPMREKIIYLTMDAVAERGPANFNSAEVCDRLGITHPMVNHYFDNRDGLLAVTAFVVYDRHIRSLWDAVAKAPADPVKRLKAWMRQQVNSTDIMGGWGAVLNYPHTSLTVTTLLDDQFRQEINELFEWNLSCLGILVLDLEKGVASALPSRIDSELRTSLARQSALVAKVSSVAWSSLGVAVWNAGRHLASAQVPEAIDQREALIEAHIDQVVNSL